MNRVQGKKRLPAWMLIDISKYAQKYDISLEEAIWELIDWDFIEESFEKEDV